MLLLLTLVLAAAFANAAQVLLVTHAASNSIPPSCPPHFLGSYGTSDHRYGVYRSSVNCATDMQVDNSDETYLVPMKSEGRVVYLQEAEVEQHIRDNQGTFSEELDAFLRRVQEGATLPALDVSQQIVFSSTSEAVVLYRTPTSALVSVPESLLPVLDVFLPRLFVPVILPDGPQPLLPTSRDAIKHVSDVLASLKFNPDVAGIIDHLSVAQMRNDIRFLTGEDGVSGIVSRHSFSQGARVAADWIKARIESTGATCGLYPFSYGFAPNVICRYGSSVNTTATVILGAHYDSRGTFGSTRAPGGNDDGSGVLTLLGIARAIQGKQISFQSNVELVAFAGEEQGLVGSRNYAKKLRENNANITLMIQADMVAYHHPGEPSQLGLTTIGALEAAQLLANVSALYSPELTVGFTHACCSDHQSFYEQKFPATSVFERAGPIADPMYHNSGDLSDRKGYDFEQVRSIAKVTFATLLHTAGFDVKASTREHD